jgi:hypothetical protein
MFDNSNKQPSTSNAKKSPIILPKSTNAKPAAVENSVSVSVASDKDSTSVETRKNFKLGGKDETKSKSNLNESKVEKPNTPLEPKKEEPPSDKKDASESIPVDTMQNKVNSDKQQLQVSKKPPRPTPEAKEKIPGGIASKMASKFANFQDNFKKTDKPPSKKGHDSNMMQPVLFSSKVC